MALYLQRFVTAGVNMKQYGKTLPKDQSALIELAKEQGWHVSKTASGHPRLLSPRGTIVVGSGTPSDTNAVWDFRSRLKRAGLKPPKGKIKVKQEKAKVESTPPTPPSDPTPEPTVEKKKRKQMTGRGELHGIILEGLMKHDSAEGVRIEVIRDYVVFKTNREYTYAAINTGLAHYVTNNQGVVRVKTGRYRATEAYRATGQTPPAPKVYAPTVPPLPANAPAAPTADEDQELENALNAIVTALGTIETIVRRTKETRKKILDILGGIK
jgi:hypothetical protein